MHSNNKLHSFEMANYIIWRKRVGKLGTHNTYCITRKEITMVINLHVITSVFIFVGQIGSKWESCFCCYVKICLTNYSTFPCFSPLTLSNCAFLLFANLNRVFIIVLKLKVANKHCQRHNGPRNWVRNLRYLIRKYIFILISNIYLFWYLIYHSGEKWNKCNQCDNASFRAGDLRIHLITHSGEKLNECNQCDNAFSHAGYLRTHLIMDNGEKSSKCNQCDYDTVSGWGQDLFRRNSYFESGQMGLK